MDARNVVFWQIDRDLGNILRQFKPGFSNFEEGKKVSGKIFSVALYSKSTQSKLKEKAHICLLMYESKQNCYNLLVHVFVCLFCIKHQSPK